MNVLLGVFFCSGGYVAVPFSHAYARALPPDGNSQKSHLNQPKVLASLSAQIASGDMSITGVMVESFLRAGKQDAPKAASGMAGAASAAGQETTMNGGGVQALEWGVSITDACVGWEETVEMLAGLNEVSVCECSRVLLVYYFLRRLWGSVERWYRGVRIAMG